MTNQEAKDILQKFTTFQKQAVDIFIDEQIKKLEHEAIFESDKIEQVLGCRKAIEKIKLFKSAILKEKIEKRNNKEYY